MTINLNQFKRWCRDNAKLALALCEAQVAAEAMRPIEDAYLQPVFESFNFVYEGNGVSEHDKRAENESEKLAGKPIPSPSYRAGSDSYFFLLHGKDESEELQAKIRAYYAACDQAHRDHGHTNLEPGQSPTAVLEHIKLQAEWALMDSAGPLFGLTEHPHMPNDRKRYLELLTGACIKALGEKQKRCARNGHTRGEANPIDPRRLRCVNCCDDLGLRNAA